MTSRCTRAGRAFCSMKSRAKLRNGSRLLSLSTKSFSENSTGAPSRRGGPASAVPACAARCTGGRGLAVVAAGDHDGQRGHRDEREEARLHFLSPVAGGAPRVGGPSLAAGL